jgi:hypothetical protein
MWLTLNRRVVGLPHDSDSETLSLQYDEHSSESPFRVVYDTNNWSNDPFEFPLNSTNKLNQVDC